MIEEQARVIAIDKNKITVESIVKSSCSGCQQIDSCGSGQIAKAIPHKKNTAGCFQMVLDFQDLFFSCICLLSLITYKLLVLFSCMNCFYQVLKI